MRKSVCGIVLAACAGSAWAAPVNDSCANAIQVGVGTTAGTTVTATADGFGACGASAGSPDVWYKYTATNDQMLVVTTCGLAGWDTVLGIFSGCPATSVNSLACNDDTASCGTQSRVSTRMTPGQTYLIRVAGYGGDTGAFSIVVSEEAPPPPPTMGPDVIVGDLIDVGYYGAFNGVSAFAVGTTSCNIGDVPVAWFAENNQHPVIAQNMYRLRGGVFEQIGQSWLKHGFASVNGDLCGTCVDPPNGSSELGVNCSDPYGSGLNGGQSYLGPRSHVNATTGLFPYPYTAPGEGFIIPPSVPGTGEGVIFRRLQVPTSAIDPAQNAGARYWVEGHYVTRDDASFVNGTRSGNGRNNASYREVRFTSATSAPGFIGATQREKSGIEAWKDADPQVQLVNAEYTDAGITARYRVASRVYASGPEQWTYVYAVQNLNAHRPATKFVVGTSGPVEIAAGSQRYSAPASHSGEPYDNSPWLARSCNVGLGWVSPTPPSGKQASAVRWGTMSTFVVVASTPPVQGSASLTIVDPVSGQPTSLAASVSVPSPSRCPADVDNGSGTGTPDGGVSIEDLLYYLELFAQGVPAADMDDCCIEVTCPGPGVTIEDLLVYLQRFADGC